MALGRTVQELLANTSSRELAEWRAYARLEPFGETRADVRAGVVAATVYNMSRGREAPALTPDDFFGPADPHEAHALQQAKLSEEIKAAFAARERK